MSENEKRLQDALFVLASNLDAGGADWRPLSYEFACKCADFARKVANGEPVPEFDASR